jgi:hypothetical protein
MPPISEAPRALDFIVSEANGWRSREKVTLRLPLAPATAIPLLPGTLLYAEGSELGTPVLTGFYLPVTLPGEIPFINSILMYPTDHRGGPVETASIMRDAEVNEAYLQYLFAITAGAEFTPVQIAQANAALLNNGIIVRSAVLAQSMVAPPPAP